MIIDVIKVEPNIKNIRELYKKISTELNNRELVSNKKIFYEELLEREKLGPIKIYEDFYLPHLLTVNVKETTILRIDGFSDKVLFILVNETEMKYKEKIHGLISKLLDKNYVDNLFSLEINDFKKTIKNI